MIADPPYTIDDAAHYVKSAETPFPRASVILQRMLEIVRVGGRVGLLHYYWPQPPPNAHPIACVGVICGYNNRMRVFSVYERLS